VLGGASFRFKRLQFCHATDTENRVQSTDYVICLAKISVIYIEHVSLGHWQRAALMIERTVRTALIMTG
jgi:hypothetical protein